MRGLIAATAVALAACGGGGDPHDAAEPRSLDWEHPVCQFDTREELNAYLPVRLEEVRRGIPGCCILEVKEQ